MQWMMLRTDKKLGKIWNPATVVADLTEEQKKEWEEIVNSISVDEDDLPF